MDAFRPSRFTSGQEPWFRIGTLDIGSAGFVSLVATISMFVRAIEGVAGPFGRLSIFNTSSVFNGEIWRMLTWWLPNEPGLGTVISIVLIFLFGAQLEGALGREGMARYLAVQVLGISVIALIIAAVFQETIAFAGVDYISSALFFTFIAYLPGVRFFFGIPGWVFGAVFFVIEFLQLLEFRSIALLVLLVARVAFILLMAKVFGLAEEVEWIPDLRPASRRGPSAGPTSSGAAFGGGVTRTPKRPGRGKKKKAEHLSVVPDEQRFEDLGIDDILDQINAFGMDSLSSEQKKILKQYSKGKKKKD